MADEIKLVQAESFGEEPIKKPDLQKMSSEERPPNGILKRSEPVIGGLDGDDSSSSSSDPECPNNYDEKTRTNDGAVTGAQIVSNEMKHLYVAFADYRARAGTEELSLEKGDLLIVTEADKKSEQAWLARIYKKQSSDSAKSCKKITISGLVSPANLIKLPWLETEKWFFGSVKRVEAEQLLTGERNQTGSFLIRGCETYEDLNHFFSLSLRVEQSQVKHYRIWNKFEDKTIFYFLNPKIKFKDMHDLIEYHSKRPDGLCTVLTEPCQRDPKDE
jgi:hypothetical protein